MKIHTIVESRCNGWIGSAWRYNRQHEVVPLFRGYAENRADAEKTLIAWIAANAGKKQVVRWG